MAKKSDSSPDPTQVDPQYVGGMPEQVEAKRKAREEATTVDGSETPSSANAGGEPPEAG